MTKPTFYFRKERELSYLLKKLRFGFGPCLLQWAGDDAAAAWTRTQCNLSNYVHWHRERRWHTSWHRNPGTKLCSSAHQDSEYRQPRFLLQGKETYIIILEINPKNHFTLIDKQQDEDDEDADPFLVNLAVAAAVPVSCALQTEPKESGNAEYREQSDCPECEAVPAMPPRKYL